MMDLLGRLKLLGLLYLAASVCNGIKSALMLLYDMLQGGDLLLDLSIAKYCNY